MCYNSRTKGIADSADVIGMPVGVAFFRMLLEETAVAGALTHAVSRRGEALPIQMKIAMETLVVCVCHDNVCYVFGVPVRMP